MQKTHKRLAIVGILGCALALGVIAASIFHARWRETREISMLNACIGKMRLFQAAKEQYAVEHGMTNGAVIPPEVLKPWLHLDWKEEFCPLARSNTYTLGRLGEEPRCSVHGTCGDFYFSDGKKGYQR